MPFTRMKVITLRVPDTFWEKIDRWRRKKSPIPSRSQAIRELTAAGMKKWGEMKRGKYAPRYDS